MARGRYLSLKEARQLDKVGQFAKEHPSTGDKDEFDAMLQAIAEDKPTKKTKSGEKT